MITMEVTNKSELDAALSAELEQGLKACAVTNLRKTTRVITQIYNEALQPVELLSTQFILLGSTALYGPVSISELADNMVMDRTTLTRDLKPLQSRDLVEIRVGGNDQRTRLVSLSPKGQQLLLEAVPLHQKVQERVEASLGEEHFRLLLSLLTETLRVGRK